jgi:hypothetical protein
MSSCVNPGCVLRADHSGECRAMWKRDAILCGAWMRIAKERCARSSPHRGDHRSRYDMDNARAMQTGRC